MKRILPLLMLTLAGVLAHPPRAVAQCNEACVEVRTPQGFRGFGCVAANDTGEACIARSTGCYTKLCYNTMITDPAGRTLAIADVCGDRVAIRRVARADHVAWARTRKRAAARPHGVSMAQAVNSLAPSPGTRVNGTAF